MRTVRAAAALVLTLAVAAPGAQAPQAVETFDAAWTTVRDKHFDRTFNGLNWDAVRDELRPRAAAAKTTGELRGVLREMLGRLGLSHFAIIPANADPSATAPRGNGDPGFDVRYTGRDLLVTEVEAGGPAAQAGVRAGWRLAAVDGVPAAEILRALPEPAHERLINVEAWRLAESRLRGAVGSTVSVTFADGQGQSIVKAIERRAERGTPVTVGNLPTMVVRVDSEKRPTPAGGTAGLIRFNVWMAAVDAPFQKAVDEFRRADGIVIDLRGNPGGLAAMLMGISGHFIAERKPLGIMKTRDAELRFAVNPRLVSADGQAVQPYGGPVAILMDALSGSASECFTGGMQSLGRARVFGQTSMGQALPALFSTLPNGDVMIHAFGDFVTPDGTRLEGRGVVPDEIVPLSSADLLAGRDRTLEAALAWIDRSRVASKPQHP